MPVDWYAESFRLTFFVGSDWSLRPLLGDLAGVAPQEVAENAVVPIRQEASIISDAQLRVVQQPSRIDIVLSDIPTRNTNDPTAPDYKKFFWIDKLESGLRRFDQISANVGVIDVAVQRIAYVPTLIWPCDDIKAVMHALRETLPLVKFNPDIDTDISWRINRPRAIDGIGLINRLSQWNTLQAAYLRLPALVEHRPIPPLLPAVFAARVEIDINTAPSNDEITNNQVPKVIHLLRALALEIAERGDQP
jgi:hypothetical protein